MWGFPGAVWGRPPVMGVSSGTELGAPGGSMRGNAGGDLAGMTRAGLALLRTDGAAAGCPAIRPRLSRRAGEGIRQSAPRACRFASAGGVKAGRPCPSPGFKVFHVLHVPTG